MLRLVLETAVLRLGKRGIDAMSVAFISAGINAFTGAWSSSQWEWTALASLLMTAAGLFLLFMREKCGDLADFAAGRHSRAHEESQAHMDACRRGPPPEAKELRFYIAEVVREEFDASPGGARWYSAGFLLSGVSATVGLGLFVGVNWPREGPSEVQRLHDELRSRLIELGDGVSRLQATCDLLLSGERAREGTSSNQFLQLEGAIRDVQKRLEEIRPAVDRRDGDGAFGPGF